MRSLVAPLILALAGCASSGTDTRPTSIIRTECDQLTECFYQGAVRDYRVLDNTSIVVFVGPSNCPYHVELDGFFCNLRGSPYIGFQDFDGRICSLDRSYIIDSPFGTQDEYCEVRSVSPLNDDELVETLAAFGIVQPLPATGSGELEVVETAESEESTPATGPALPVPAGAESAGSGAETG
jgi:hypothetical protein